MFKIELINGEFKNLGKLQSLNFEDKQHLINHLASLLEMQKSIIVDQLKLFLYHMV